jgi:aspartate ammonia-lyase
LPLIAHNLLLSLDLLRSAAVSLRDNCVAGILANEERCRKLLENSVVMATALVPHLGYETATELAREALATGRPLKSVVLERGLISAEVLEGIFSTKAMTRPGIPGAKRRRLRLEGK